MCGKIFPPLMRWMRRVYGAALDMLPSSVAAKEPDAFGGSIGLKVSPSIQALVRADLQKFQSTWLRPDNATLFVVGDKVMNSAVGYDLLKQAVAAARAKN